MALSRRWKIKISIRMNSHQSLEEVMTCLRMEIPPCYPSRIEFVDLVDEVVRDRMVVMMEPLDHRDHHQAGQPHHHDDDTGASQDA